MGAWSYKILCNDTALDSIDNIKHDGFTAKSLDVLFHSEYIEDRLLAVALVDISKNGIDKNILGDYLQPYISLFKGISNTDLSNYHTQAINVLQDEIKAKSSTWNKPTQAPRNRMLAKIYKRMVN